MEWVRNLIYPRIKQAAKQMGIYFGRVELQAGG
jgi:hypothetical protein